jgi:hypothetical protein
VTTQLRRDDRASRHRRRPAVVRTEFGARGGSLSASRCPLPRAAVSPRRRFTMTVPVGAQRHSSRLRSQLEGRRRSHSALETVLRPPQPARLRRFAGGAASFVVRGFRSKMIATYRDCAPVRRRPRIPRLLYADGGSRERWPQARNVVGRSFRGGVATTRLFCRNCSGDRSRGARLMLATGNDDVETAPTVQIRAGAVAVGGRR